MSNTEDRLQQLVNDSMKTELKKTDAQVVKYASPEEYKRATGKRFRMTKEQKARGISREEAFREFMA